MSTSKQTRQPIQIHADGGAPVVLTTHDFDRFVMTQREIVDACRNSRSPIDMAEQVRDRFSDAVREVHRWCREHGDVAECIMVPRVDDILLAVIATHEDDEGRLHDEMASLDQELFRRYRFRLHFVLFRASERDGVDGFAPLEDAKVIYRAERN